MNPEEMLEWFRELFKDYHLRKNKITIYTGKEGLKMNENYVKENTIKERAKTSEENSSKENKQ